MLSDSLSISVVDTHGEGLCEDMNIRLDGVSIAEIEIHADFRAAVSILRA
jgi:hypothetical protein